MPVSCEGCQKIHQFLALQPTNRYGEWSVPIQEDSAAVLLRKKSLTEAGEHYSIKHAQFGPFTEEDGFRLRHIRDLNRVVGWQVGLLCQVLGKII